MSLPDISFSQLFMCIFPTKIRAYFLEFKVFCIRSKNMSIIFGISCELQIRLWIMDLSSIMEFEILCKRERGHKSSSNIIILWQSIFCLLNCGWCCEAEASSRFILCINITAPEPELWTCIVVFCPTLLIDFIPDRWQSGAKIRIVTNPEVIRLNLGQS